MIILDFQQQEPKNYIFTEIRKYAHIHAGIYIEKKRRRNVDTGMDTCMYVRCQDEWYHTSTLHSQC